MRAAPVQRLLLVVVLLMSILKHAPSAACFILEMPGTWMVLPLNRAEYTPKCPHLGDLVLPYPCSAVGQVLCCAPSPQVLRYQNGQKYDSHWDWFDEKDDQDRSKGNRIATVLMYLEGGGHSLLRLRLRLAARASRLACTPAVQHSAHMTHRRL